MPWLRRAAPPAREGRCNKDPRPADRRHKGHKGNEGHKADNGDRGGGGRSAVSSLTDRIRGFVAPAFARSNSSELRRGRPDGGVPAYPAPADLSTLGGDWCGDCFVVDRRWSPSARYGKEAVGTFAQCLEE